MTEEGSQLDSQVEYFSVEPFVMDHAEVVGPASADDEAAWMRAEAELSRPRRHSGLRGLLHGKRPARLYSKCNRCTLLKCAQSIGAKRKCTGHCKKRKKLFICNSERVFESPPCVDIDAGDVPDLPVDGLLVSESAVVTAEAPFMGCAIIAGAVNGCPRAGSRVTVGAQVGEIVESICREEKYTPRPVDFVTCRAPLFPYGLCFCRIALPGRDTESFGACDVTQVDLGSADSSGDKNDDGGPSSSGSIASSFGRADASASTSPPEPDALRQEEEFVDGIVVVVERRGDVTYTGFSDYSEPGDEVGATYQRSVVYDRRIIRRGVRRRPIVRSAKVTLTIFSLGVEDADSYSEEVEEDEA